MAEAVENLGPVTIEDVRKTLTSAELDPRKTNSGAVRRMLGRGSMGTIQKHLEALREELMPKAIELVGDIPAVPKELADALWRSAWTSAQSSTAQALATALLERDHARDALAATAADLNSLATDADTAMTTASEAQAVAKMALEALEATKAAAATSSSIAEKKLAETLLSLDSVASGMNAAHKLETAHAETKIATLQGVIDRLTEQLAEVKSLLPRVSVRLPEHD